MGIMQQNDSFLRKGGIPEEDGNRRECNEVEEAIVGPSSMDMYQSPSRHLPTISVAAMMIK